MCQYRKLCYFSSLLGIFRQCAVAWATDKCVNIRNLVVFAIVENILGSHAIIW